ncbi:hypothetical protein [Mycolicibacterium monacense]|uniref:Uncharacterized protein n=2 Tax=Mycobacteriaceae TaxID=1762 RepID=A0AAD1J3P4_MYCMB|nr:hypothetical protein [Mycolicibacterium monacense]MDA4103257.1 hypothetical protein [Mycolicibacterium monacense DSM 44395]OBB56853.1 hypothetical protein A6B34_05785 [Mycolicibacterium monacense]OBF56173.1 hypothetical protein A5778_06810 [Mycolicibacterium monacense]ORB12905.1 hypothetical protein BST34_25900 [Mycolicibacterium monacense DSM 44395]QHP88853.1 hypothetical protein EWR22_27815 [Mycolicibacterium monacense DSM 44395]
MDLRWWPIAVIGLLGLLVCFALAVLLPLSPDRRRLRPMANIARLVRLPEYARAARLRSVSTIATLVLLVVLFGAAAVAAARPTGADDTFARAHPEDVMLCVANPVTEPTTGALLRHFARQAGAFENERIGLTSRNTRVVPLTRDYQYAAGRFTDLADPDRAVIDQFAAPVTYTDYASSVDDVLALCLSGFPDFEQKTSHRRSVIYLGPPTLRAADEQRPALFDAQRVADLADAAGAQINVITSGEDTALRALTERTDGQYTVATTESAVTESLDQIDGRPAPLVLDDGTRVTGQTQDAPVAVLAVVLVVTAMLSVTLVVLRR